MILYDADNHYRQIYTDGRKLPEDYNAFIAGGTGAFFGARGQGGQRNALLTGAISEA